MSILKAVIACLVIGALLGFLLAIADKYLAVKEDPRVGVVTSMLPGANCGGCGYPGCSGMAASLVEGSNKNVSACRPSKPEARAKIIEYLGSTPGPDGSTITGLK